MSCHVPSWSMVRLPVHKSNQIKQNRMKPQQYINNHHGSFCTPKAVLFSAACQTPSKNWKPTIYIYIYLESKTFIHYNCNIFQDKTIRQCRAAARIKPTHIWELLHGSLAELTTLLPVLQTLRKWNFIEETIPNVYNLQVCEWHKWSDVRKGAATISRKSSFRLVGLSRNQNQFV